MKDKEEEIKKLLTTPRMRGSRLIGPNRSEGLLEMLGLVKGKDTKSMIEIGCHQGVSTELFALHFKHVTTIDPWSGRNKLYRRTSNKLKTKYNNVTILRKPSLGASRSIKDSSVGFVYVDGSHAMANVIADLILYLPKLQDDGLIGGHDYVSGNRVARGVDAVRKLIPHSLFNVFDDSSWIFMPNQNNDLDTIPTNL